VKTVVALYDDYEEAQRAVEDLVKAGIDRSSISIVAGDSEGMNASRLTPKGDGSDTGAEGAATGALLGGIGGAILGITALAIPGIGPVVAAGPLIAGLVGAGVGAAVGGLVGALVDAGLPQENAGYYAEGVRRGGTLVSVEAEDNEVDRIIDILDLHDPVDINERVSSWRQQGWSGFDSSADQTADREWAASRHEEFASEPGPSPTRTSFNESNSRTNGGTYPASTTEQMQTGSFANGGSKQSSDYPIQEQSMSDSTYRTGDPAWRGAQRPYDVSSYDEDFHNHYQTYFVATGILYEEFEPAYRYGYTLATDPRFEGRDWSEIEPEARTYWTNYHSDSPWEKFKDAIRHGWEEVKQRVKA